MAKNFQNREFARPEIIGNSPAWLTEIQKVTDFANSDETVLISGESGTGKDVCARAIHHNSFRAAKPFVAFNCARPEELIENELFGHAAGAFTSANTASSGLLEYARGGTLFLDEIEELSRSAQAKFLRVLENKEILALGSQKSRKLDVRLIAATNVAIGEAVRTGALRQDLYYRLNVLRLDLPPLRERPGDVKLLALFFLRRSTNKRGEPITGFTSAAIKKLDAHDWPGNVRELANTIQRAALLSCRNMLDARDLTFENITALEKVGSFKEQKAKFVAQWEAAKIRDYLKVAHGNVSHAAERAKMARSAFWRLMRKHQIGTRLPD